MRTMTTAIAAAAALMLSANISSHEMPQQTKKMDSTRVEQMMQSWPKASREAANDLMKKYGPPAAVTADAAIWGKAGPWKRSIVYRTEVPHNFPGPHTDVMQQFIDYKVPLNMYDDLARYDGSVVLERTAGEMSARCDKEGANFLALNLANEIVTGKRSIESARKKYGEQIMAMKAHKSAPYTEKLIFTVPSGTRDPDQAL